MIDGKIGHYTFLATLHLLLKPRAYLEIGVQTGRSLAMALDAKQVVGVDIDFSNLTYEVNAPHVTLAECTSEEFFSRAPSFVDPDTDESTLDLVHIDGSHLAEDVWLDFRGAETLAGPRTIIAFDDMLPRNNYEASREFHEGDWTGDAWKVGYLLKERRPTMPMLYVDTHPTGFLVCWPAGATEGGCDPMPAINWERITSYQPVPNEILNREVAVSAADALLTIGRWLGLEGM